MVGYQGDKLIASADEEWVSRYHEGANPQPNEIRNGGIEVVLAGGIYDLQF